MNYLKYIIKYTIVSINGNLTNASATPQPEGKQGALYVAHLIIFDLSRNFHLLEI